MSTKNQLDIFKIPFHNPSIFEIRAFAKYDGDLIDFCVPANSYFPPQEMFELLKENMHDILEYYPDYAQEHQNNIAKLCGISPENIIVANGITEIITILCRDCQGSLLTSVPTFGRWTDLPKDFNTPVHFIQHEKTSDFKLSARDIINKVNETGAQTLAICNPNNPTGAWFSSQDIKTIQKELSHIDLIIIDESFIDFSDLESAETLAVESNNIIVVKSMGKSLGCHGVRLGYAVTNTQLAEKLRKKLPYWNINGFASFILKNIDRYKDSYTESFVKIADDREYMYKQLQTIPNLKTYPSKCNFLFSELPKGISGTKLRDILLVQYGLIVRECSNKIGSTEYFLRNVVRKRADTDKLVIALREVLEILSLSNT